MMSLNQPFEDSYPALFKRLQQFLLEQHARAGRTILVVDEAQNLELEALEELRMLSNINADKDQYLQLILVGQPQLKDLVTLSSTIPVCSTGFLRLPSQTAGAG